MPAAFQYKPRFVDIRVRPPTPDTPVPASLKGLAIVPADYRARFSARDRRAPDVALEAAPLPPGAR